MLSLLLRLRPVTNPGNNERADELRMAQAEMQGGKAAHREPDDVGRAVAHGAHHVGQVLGRADLIVGADALRHIGGRIAARAVRRAMVMAGKETDLWVPAARVAGKFVHENKRRPAANRASFNLPETRVDVLNGATISAAKSPRLLQLGLRLEF